MKKRNLFAVLMMIAVVALTITALNSCAPKGKNIGLQLYSLRDSIRNDVPGVIAKTAEMGYKFSELAGYRDGKFYNMEPVDFKALCDSVNLPILSSHTSRALPDSANYDETMAWWDKCIDAHVAIGANFIVQPSMGRSGYQSIEGLKAWCDYFNEVGARCNAKGIRFGYHNHDREVMVKPDSIILVYDYMLQNTDPTKVMFQMDIGHLFDGGADPVAYFNKYPGRFELWHIAETYEIGSTGKLDWEAIWAAAPVSGMKYGIVEVERYNFDQFTSCKVSLDTLNAAPYVVLPL